MQAQVGAEFAGRLQLVSYQLSSQNPGPGDGLDIQLTWRSLAPIPDEHRAFLSLVDEQGEEVAGDDDVIGTRQNPTSGWAVGAQGVHRPGITIPRQYPSGRLELRVGVLNPDRKTRLALTNSGGNEAGDTWVTIAVMRS
jgi:hypothetical protein